MREQVKRYFSWGWFASLILLMIISFNMGAYKNIKPGLGHLAIVFIIGVLLGGGAVAMVFAVIEFRQTQKTKKRNDQYNFNRKKKRKKDKLPPLMKRMEGVHVDKKGHLVRGETP